MNTEKIGDFLSSLRKSKGFTQQDVADQLNLSNKTISKWESGTGLPDVSALPVLAELYDVSVDDILAGQRLKREVIPQNAPERWEYYIVHAQIKLDIAFLVAITLTIINFATYAFPYTGNNTGWQRPIGIILCLMIMAIGIILATYPLRQVPKTYQMQIFRRAACCLLPLIAADLISVSSSAAQGLFMHFGEGFFIYNLHWAAAALIVLGWWLLSRRWGDLLTGGRRRMFIIGAVLLFLSDAPATVFFLINPGLEAFTSMAQYEAWVTFFDKALPYGTYAGLIILTASVVWQMILERKQKGK